MNKLKGIFLIAGNTVTGVMRGVILSVMLLLAAILILLSLSSNAFDSSQIRNMLMDSGLAIISVLGAIIAILTGFNMIPNEIETRTIYPVLSKPVSRWQYITGKYLGAVGINAITTTLLSILFFIIYIYRAPGHVFDMRLIPAVLMIFAILCTLSAIIIFLSTFMSWIGTIIVTACIWFAGNYAQFLFDMTEHGSGSAFSKNLLAVVHQLLPNFQSMDMRYLIVQEQVPSITFSMISAPLFLQGIPYIIICMLLAIIIFNYREL